MTEELYSTDAYVTTCDATVVEVSDEGVVLDRTVFYARGGGQPGDTGTLRWDGGQARVTDTYKQSGRLLHVVDPSEAPQPGTAVTCEIDWERRHTLMRIHTALHALSGIVFTVSVSDERGLIAVGRVTRVVVDKARFLEKVHD